MASHPYSQHAVVSSPLPTTTTTTTTTTTATTCPPLTMENITTALSYLSGSAATSHSSTTLTPQNDKIKEAEQALLSWEKENPSLYAHSLLSILYSLEETIGVGIRLGALLSLKACVNRTWKDRGRGLTRRSRRSDGMTNANMLSGDIKDYVRKCILSMVTNGGADVIMEGGEGEKKWRVVRFLLEEKTLQKSASSLLSKIGRLDLPLSFHHLIPTLVQYTTLQSLPPPLSHCIDNNNNNNSSSNNNNKEEEESLIMNIRHNASDALEMVLSELCSKRLLVDKKYIASISCESVGLLVQEGWSKVMSFLGSFISSSSSSSPSMTTTMTTTTMKEEATLRVVTYAILLTKILSHLFLSALPALVSTKKENGESSPSSSTSAVVDYVYTTTIEAIPALLQFFTTKEQQENEDEDKEKEEITEKLEILLETLGYLIVNVQQSHPVTCSRFVGPFLEMFYGKLMESVAAMMGSSSNNNKEQLQQQQHQHSLGVSASLTIAKNVPPPDCFLMCAMKFLANIVSCSHYMPDEETNEAIAAMRSETVTSTGEKRAITSKGDVHIDQATIQAIVKTIWFDFFTADKLTQLANISIKHFMILSDERLDEWEADAESFAITESMRNVDDDLAACAQNLYLALVESKAGRPIVAPLVASMLGDVEGQLNAAKFEAGEFLGDDSNKNALLWDAVYTAAGLSANILDDYEGFDIDAWFEKCLVPCLALVLQGRNKTNVLPIMRYRLVWLIGCFAHCISDTKTSLNVLVSVLVNESYVPSDIAVRLAAVQALTAILNIHFDIIDIYYHHLERVISSLYRLVNDCTDISSQAQSLSCISLLLFHVVASGRKVDDATANATVGPLPALWDVAIEQNILLRRDVLSILSGVGSAVDRAQVGHLYPVALPMINGTLDPTCRDRDVCLVEDVLALWLSLLRLATSYELHWENLFGRVKDILEQDLEHLKILMMITEGYILLGGASFLSAHSSTLQAILTLVVGKTKPRGAAYIGLVLEALLRKFPVEGGTLLLQGGIMTTMLSSCSANYHADSACEPDRVVVLYLTAIARSLIGNPTLLDGTMPFISSHPEQLNLSFGAQELIQMYMEKFKGMEAGSNGALHQKLWLLFLLSLLPPTPTPATYSNHVLERMVQLLDICLTVLSQHGLLDPSSYTVGYDSEEETIETGQKMYETIIDAERKKDVANTSDVRSVFKVKMEGLASALGNDLHQQILTAVEPVILQQLERIVNS